MRSLWVACRLFVFFTLVLGVLYPLLVFGVGQVFFKHKAQGSLLYVDGKAVASSLLTNPGSYGDKRWFQSRFSAVATSDMSNSGGTNLLFGSNVLSLELDSRRNNIASFENVSKDLVPSDAIFSGASGWENLISLEYALLQLPRVAKANNIAQNILHSLVESHVDKHILTKNLVNTSELNVALLKILSN